MLPVKRILFPVDYSDHCRSVVPYVKEMAGHFSAQPTLVHAYGVGALPYTELAAADPSWPEKVQRREEQRLGEFAAQMFPGLHADCILEEGEPGTVIDKVIQRQGTDLVMMPTHGLGPLRRLLLGSVTAKVLHDVSAAVWTGAGRMVDNRPRRYSYESILCAVDLSDESEAVVRAAAGFAGSYHARLSLVHVVELPPPNVDVDFTQFKQELIDADNERLRDLKNKLGIDASLTCMDGATANCVCREAIQKEADLIVVGRGRAQGALSRIWSRLYTIVRESPCPVLSI
ncbi:MAG TPA: universal stress protein [Bryobacteraceae bacterium]|nr:universal stress protein [Bryobacteraceae bacterium]